MEENENKDDVVSEQLKEGDAEGKVADRPAINYERELERKNAQIERLRQEAELRKNEVGTKRDQNDMSTWADHELKAVAKSVDPSALPYKDQAEDLLLERKVRSMREKERMQEKRALSELELKTKYPEALDPSSEMAVKMEQIMFDYDLQKSPAGKLAAAKIAASELGKGRSSDSAKERKAEADRIASVKGQMVDGDRSKPSVSEGPKRLEEIEAKVRNESLTQADGFAEALKHAGIERSSFFRK